MLLVVVLSLIVVGSSYSNAQECSDGLFYDNSTNECVPECPCGFFGNTYTRQCMNDSYYLTVGFNQTEYNFSASSTSPPGTKLGTTWINIPVSVVSLENGSLAPIEIYSISSYYNYYGPYPFIYIDVINIDLYFNDQQLLAQGYPISALLNLTKDNITFCDDKHILIPIDIYTQSEFSAIGILKFDIRIQSYISNFYFYLSTTVSVDVRSVCDQGELYLFSTGQCVVECPCGTTRYPGFCHEVTNTVISGIPRLSRNDVDPQTPQGTNVFSFNLLFNISEGSPLAELDTNISMTFSLYYGGTYHDGDSSPYPYYYYYYFYGNHYYQTQYGYKLPGIDPAAVINLEGQLDSIFPLSNSTEIEQCLWGGSIFLKVPMEIQLHSPYIYHLGTTWLSSFIQVQVPSDDYYYSSYYYYLPGYFFIKANAECPSHLHYDFDSGSCVSQCPCGFIGFDYHIPHYCEPAPNGPSWWYWYGGDYYSYARFSETNYLLELPWNNPPRTETFVQNIFVYPDLNYFLESGLLGNESLVLAHVELLYIGSNYTTGEGYAIDTPMVTLTGPTLPESENDIVLNTTGDRLDLILKNSSQYGLEYCYDELQERVVGYIPITVTVTSPRQYSLLANHSYSLYMTFSSPNDPALNSNLYYSYDTFNLTISITEGDLGQTPSPPTSVALEEGKDFLPFIDVKSFNYSELEKTLDGASEIISIPIGLPFGNSIQTKAFVGANGIISFEREWYFSYPTRFPTSGFWTRNGFVVAPFWNDHDLRKSGSVRYAVMDSDERKETASIIKNISNFIQLNHEQAAIDDFEGTWMLLAHWDKVHPYPHGSYDSYYSNYYNDYINKQNSYQAVVITDGVDSYALFTYHCDQMEWTGYWEHGVVGYNAKGDHYANHPSSGFEVVDLGVACVNDFYGVSWSNLIFKTSLPPDFGQQAKKDCRTLYRTDNVRIEAPISQIAESLEPCPCTLWQAWRDWGRFQQDLSNNLCFVQRFSVEVAVEDGIAYFTQQCCYSPWGSDDFGALISSGHFSGSMLSYHPINHYLDYLTYDKKFRDACCGVAQMCSLYVNRRPSQNCSGYDPPTWTWGLGDPHITTLDSRSYTFNGWGEYVLMEYVPQGSTSAKFSMQARTNTVDETNPNAATQFSAFAFGIPGELSFQIGIQGSNFYVYKTSGGVEDISTTLANINDTYNNTNRKAELVRQAQDSIMAVFSNGVGITINVTRGIPNFILSLPSSFKGQTQGLLGNYNGDKMDEFVPRHQNSPLSDSISDQEIHEMFGQTWAITEGETLFNYSLDGSNFASFQHPSHQPAFLDQLTLTEEQMEQCGSNKQCAYDIVQTGDVEIGLATMDVGQSNTMDQTILANFPPSIVGESVFRVTVGQQAQYTFTVTDPGDSFVVEVLGGLPTASELIQQEGEEGSLFTFTWAPQQLTNMSLTFFARDSLNASSTLSLRLEVCACANGGQCTLDGLLSTDDTTVIMNCLCTEAFDGEFCEEDRNGCLRVACYEGVECLDVPAPGVGAECGPCPPGFTGNGTKCLDINECEVYSHLCQHICVNTEGSYNCDCWQGYQMIQEGVCQDIDECSGVHDCQQECENVPGSYNCSCYEGFELSSDKKSCNVLSECLEVNDCSHTCAIVDGIPTCYCNLGYKLAVGSNTQCVDKDECNLYSPCDQECTNLPGTFECSCKTGYVLNDDENTCKDVDECLEAALYDIELCTQNTVCLNTEGSFECLCVPGFEVINGTCQREVESPPPLEQHIPPNAEANRLKVLITGLVPSTFTADRKQSFKIVTAELVTEYCTTNDCTYASANSRRRRQTVIVEPKNVAIQSISEDSAGRLIFNMYVELEQGILALDVLKNALQGNEQLYVDGVDGITAIAFDVLTATSTTASPSPTTPTVEDEQIQTIIIITVLVGAVLLILSVVLVVIVGVMIMKKKKYITEASTYVIMNPIVEGNKESLPE